MEAIKNQYFSLVEALVRKNTAQVFSGTIHDVTVWETTERGEPAAVFQISYTDNTAADDAHGDLIWKEHVTVPISLHSIPEAVKMLFPVWE